MKSFEIVRSWKDEEYRRSLNNEERGVAPENPAGLYELSDADMGAVIGGNEYPYPTNYFLTVGCCTFETICGSQGVGSFGCCPQLPLV